MLQTDHLLDLNILHRHSSGVLWAETQWVGGGDGDDGAVGCHDHRHQRRPQKPHEGSLRGGERVAALPAAAGVTDVNVDVASVPDDLGRAAEVCRHAALGGEHVHGAVASPGGVAALLREALGGGVHGGLVSVLQGAEVTHQDPRGQPGQCERPKDAQHCPVKDLRDGTPGGIPTDKSTHLFLFSQLEVKLSLMTTSLK